MDTTDAPGVSLPKLPELAEEDIKAVRSFLPGKLLGRTAALLSLMLLVLGFAVAVDQGLKRLLEATVPLERWQYLTLLLGLPALVVVTQAVLEWRALRIRRRLQSLAVQTGAVPKGYFRIGPYLDTAEDRQMFNRADRAHEKVLEWIKRSVERVPLYLTGDSGSGKSSLLNAYVLPALREDGWTVVEARAWQDPEAALRQALAGLPSPRRTPTGQAPPLRDQIEAAARRGGAGLLIVLDQFEEFVILGKPEQQESFASLINDLRASPIRKFTLLLALRSDYQTFLEDRGLPALRHGENFFQVGRFTFAAASKFLQGSDLGLQPDALNRLLDSVAAMEETPGLVRPILLNVLGHVMATGQESAPSLDAGKLLRIYIEQAVNQPTIRDYAAPVLEKLVTEQGTKEPRNEQILVTETRLRRGEVRGVMNALSVAALARPLDTEQAVWELSHDFIARAVARYLGRRRRDLLRRGAFYAAPALLALALLAGFGVMAWDVWIPLQIGTRLAGLGITIISSSDGIAGERNANLTDDSFQKAGPLLLRIDATTPLTRLDLGYSSVSAYVLEKVRSSSKLIGDLAPLKGLTNIKSLNVGRSRVSDLTPLKGLTALTSLDLSDSETLDLAPLIRSDRANVT